MFKAGDKVRCIQASSMGDLELGKEYIVKQDSKTKQILSRNRVMVSVLGVRDAINNYGWYADRFKLVEEEKPVSTNPVGSANPCITTEEVKVVKTKIVSGRLEYVLQVEPVRNPNMVQLRGMGSINCTSDDLRKLARQLDEIANVLSNQDNGEAKTNS